MNKPQWDWNNYTGNLGWLKSSTCFMVRAGSWAYGTNTANSDEDFRGICIAPRLGSTQNFEQMELKTPDCVIFDLRKFVRLAAQANPNIVELAFTHPSDVLIHDPLCDMSEIRNEFLTKRIKSTYSGYAIAQLKKASMREGDPRQGKNIMHLVRLLRMGREILEGKGVIVKRPDYEELLEIKAGSWSYSKVLEWATEEDKALELIAEQSNLPHSPDYEKIDKWLNRVVDNWT